MKPFSFHEQECIERFAKSLRARRAWQSSATRCPERSEGSPDGAKDPSIRLRRDDDMATGPSRASGVRIKLEGEVAPAKSGGEVEVEWNTIKRLC